MSVSCASLSASLPPALNAILFLCREQVSTPIGPSVPNPVCWFVHCVHHFEKMLYDVAQLARVYLHAWLLTSERSQAVTGNEFFRTITEEILDYVVREMAAPAGGFYSTQDAGQFVKFCVKAGSPVPEPALRFS
jgi:hypothetical protein